MHIWTLRRNPLYAKFGSKGFKRGVLPYSYSFLPHPPLVGTLRHWQVWIFVHQFAHLH